MLSNNKYYVLKHNKQFFTWYQEKKRSGYESFLDINDMQKMIDYITFWYETKVPERDFLSSKTSDLTKYMTYNELIYRLDLDIYDFLMCKYRMSDIEKEELIFNIYDKNTEEKYTYKANPNNGNILDCNGLITEATLETLLNKIIINNKLDYKELLKIVKNHRIDLVLRKILLNLVSEKILSNDTVSDEVRILRYHTFVDEFNKNIEDLNISLTTSPKENIKTLIKL